MSDLTPTIVSNATDSISAPPSAQRLLAVIGDLAAELRPGLLHAAPPGLDSSLDRDLGFDSLGRVELISRLETRFDVTLPDSAFATAETPRDLLRALAAAGRRGAAPDSGAPVAEDIDTSSGSAADVVEPTQAKTLIDVLQWHAARTPDRVHIRLYGDEGTDGGDTITYGELLSGASAIASDEA